MKHKSVSHILRRLDIVLLILSLVPLLYCTFINRFPLVFPDTGTYILSGHSGDVPVDRPLMYGLFVRHISLSSSLWYVVVIQAILTMIIIMMTARSFWPDSWIRKSWILITLLSIVTGISNYVSQIMPDIFTALMILSIFLFLFYRKKSIIINILIAIFIVFCTMTHYSNLAICTGLVFLLALTSLVSKNKLVKIQQVMWLALIIGFTWIFSMTLNYLYDAGFKISRAPNVVLMARLQAIGLVSEYLNDQCGEKNIPLCKYKDEMPIYSFEFLWTNSPLYDKTPPHNIESVWLMKDKEYAPIIRDIMTSPKYLKRFVKISFSETLLQLTMFTIEDLPNSIKDSPVAWTIDRHYEGDKEMYYKSQQAHYPYLHFGISSTIQAVSVIISLIGLIVILCIRKLRRVIPPQYFLMLVVIIFGQLINAWVCSSFSTLVIRYQSRIIWLIPLAFIVLLIIILESGLKSDFWKGRKSKLDNSI
jgi:hypothetical protein